MGVIGLGEGNAEEARREKMLGPDDDDDGAEWVTKVNSLLIGMKFADRGVSHS